MEQYDFLLIYEVKNREFDSLCLLKYELDRRGYRTKISNTIMLKEKPEPVDAKVVVMPSLYGTNTVMLAKPFVKEIKKIVNLQWEQVFYKSIIEQKSSSRYRVTGLARRGAHIAWGPENVKRLTQDSRLPVTHVKMTGHVAHDFMRPELSDYYLNRSELLQQYHLQPDKKIILFISSFVYVKAAESRIKRELHEVQGMANYMEFVEITQQTQAEILNWFKELLINDPTYEIIYRPHPAENISDLVEFFEKTYNNFHVIRDYSVQQWIKASDVILNWFSTSLTEILRANKASYILRPFEIPERFDYPIVKDTSSYIKSKNDFAEIFNNNRKPIQQTDTIIPDYYWYDPKCPSYKIICDFLEDVLLSNLYNMNISKKDLALYRLQLLQKSVKISLHYRLSLSKNFFAGTLKQFKQHIAENQQSTFEQKQNLIRMNRTEQRDIDLKLEKISTVLNGTCEEKHGNI